MSKAKITAGASVLTLATGLIVAFEGYYPGTYADPVGIPTSCYGHVGPENAPGRRFSEGECKALLEGDLSEAFSHVARCIKAPLKDYEAAALTSAAYNAGPKIVCGSTLQRKANAGDKAGMCAELSKWVYARGIKLRGLVRRRAAERAMCEGHV